MNMTELSLSEFVSSLASSAPVPGGGGAAALVGAVGMAAGNMTASLTLGKKKFEHLRLQLEEYCAAAAGLEKELLSQIQGDADCFAPLAAAYRLPKEDPGREVAVEAATLQACDAPRRVMELCCRGIELAGEIAKVGSRLALSDAGCSASMLRSALESAALNLFINTAALKDREAAEKLNAEALSRLRESLPKAEKLFRSIASNYISEEF